jgi:hypothetical protein
MYNVSLTKSYINVDGKRVADESSMTLDFEQFRILIADILYYGYELVSCSDSNAYFEPVDWCKHTCAYTLTW